MNESPSSSDTSTTSRDGLQANLGWALRATSMAFQTWADGAVSELPSGARGYLVLVAAEEGEPRSQLAIARQLGLDKTIMTYLVDALVKQELLERRLDANDRRVRLLVLTSAGRQALATAHARLAVTEQRLLSGLTPEQAEQFRELLTAVASTTQNTATDCDPS